MRQAQFYPEHVRELVTHSFEATHMDTLELDLESVLRARWDNELSVTLEDDRGQVVVCAGLAPQWPGVACVWCMFSTEIRARDGASIILRLRALRDKAIAKHQLHRLQLDTQEGDARTARAARVLGFRREGVMPAYGTDGSDWVRWGYVPGRD